MSPGREGPFPPLYGFIPALSGLMVLQAPWWPLLHYRKPPCLLPSAALRSTSGNVRLNDASGGDRSLLIFEELSSLQLFT